MVSHRGRLPTRYAVSLVIALSNIDGACAQSSTRPSTGSGLQDNPYSQLLEEIDLPPLPDRAAGRASSAVELGPIDLELTGCKINVFSALADLGGKYEFSSRPANRAGAKEWLLFISNPGGTPPLSDGSIIGSNRTFSQPLARVFAKSNRLVLDWNSNNITKFNGQLANAILELSSAGHSHSIRLRKLVTKSAIELDLTESQLRIPLELLNCPLRKSLALVVNDVASSGYNSITPTFQVEPTSRRGMLGERIVLSRADEAGTEIHLALADRPMGPELRIRAAYKIDGERGQPFVAAKINSLYERMQKSMQDANLRMADARSAIPSIQQQIRGVSARQARDAPEQLQKELELRSLKSALKRAQGTMRRYSRSLPKLESSISSMQSVIEVGKSLHKNVQLHVAVIAISGDRSIDLVRFGDAKLSRDSLIAPSP
jgi:hypothetical protein